MIAIQAPDKCNSLHIGGADRATGRRAVHDNLTHLPRFNPLIGGADRATESGMRDCDFESHISVSIP